MGGVGWGLTLCIIFCNSFQFALSSYLDYPRINFHGQFRADSNTHNNDVCNYREAPIPEDRYIDWNLEGTNEFEFVNAKVSSVVTEESVLPTLDDPLVGHSIIGNMEGPLGKLSDGSTRDPEVFTVYGLQFGIKWVDELKFPANNKEDIAFHGNVNRFLITQNVWTRIPCYNSTNHGENPYQGSIAASTQFMSSVDVNLWGNLHPPHHPGQESAVLKALQGKRLSIRVNLFYTTRKYLPYLPFNATLGYMVGSIGVHDTMPESPATNVTYDTANIPGKRALIWNRDFVNTPVNMKFNGDDDICRGFSREDIRNEQWANYAPFEVYERGSDEFEIQLDLSNSIPNDLQNSIRDMGVLQLAIDAGNCLDLIGDPLMYRSAEQLYINGGIHTIQVNRDVTNIPLLLVQVGEYGWHRLCNKGFAQIVLREEEYLVRPMNYYADHLERNHVLNNTQEVYVTKYGKPAGKINVSVNYFKQPDSGPPAGGVAPTTLTATTDEYGIARFTFKRDLSKKIPVNRQYYNPPACLKGSSYNLPIDGTLYHFYYCANSSSTGEVCNKDIITYFLAFGDFDPPEDPNWVDDIHPILSQYARISPMMTKILDMSNYTNVVQERELMEMSLCNTNVEDSAYMPTTRDLSDEKRKMIVDWLTGPKLLTCAPNCTIEDLCDAPRLDVLIGSNPLFDSSDSTRKPDPGVPECPYPSDRPNPFRLRQFSLKKVDLYCDKQMEFNKSSDRQHDILETLRQFNYKVGNLSACQDGAMCFGNLGWKQFQLDNKLTDLNLNDFLGTSESEVCTVDNLKKTLQNAIYLEWSTIPVYLTSLYSIIEGCNYEIYELIQSIVREEMLHLTQVANTLIAMDVTPIVDDNTVSNAIFKDGHLPGNVLPTLKVTLEKLSLEHVRRVFMMIEVPQNRSKYDKHTIGWFYNNIIECMTQLNESGDLSDEDFKNRPGLQVKWPRADNHLIEVTDINTAIEGFRMIIEQGEGAGYIQENQVEGGNYSHFYKFEEIVCQKRLVKVGNNYSYTGNDIPFNENGVWPMRSTPTVASIPKNSNCYIESQAFHRVYRLLLRKLQDLFNGDDGGKHQKTDLDMSLQLMETLQAHAKKMMWVKKRPDCTAACEACGECKNCAYACDKCDQCLGCGPVWEYDWPGSTPTPPFSEPSTLTPTPTPKEEL